MTIVPKKEVAVSRREAGILVVDDEQAETRGEEMDWTFCLDDIARGVEEKLDSLIGNVMSITAVKRTVDIARCLGIPEDQIERWVEGRRKRNTGRVAISPR